MVRDGEVVMVLLSWLHDDAFEILLVVGEESKSLPITLGADGYLGVGDLAVAVRVDVGHEDQLSDAIVALLQLAEWIHFDHTVCVLPVHVHF